MHSICHCHRLSYLVNLINLAQIHNDAVIMLSFVINGPSSADMKYLSGVWTSCMKQSINNSQTDSHAAFRQSMETYLFNTALKERSPVK